MTFREAVKIGAGISIGWTLGAAVFDVGGKRIFKSIAEYEGDNAFMKELKERVHNDDELIRVIYPNRRSERPKKKPIMGFTA